MLYKGIKYIGFISMLIFGGIFVLRWILKETKNRLLYLGLIIKIKQW